MRLYTRLYLILLTIGFLLLGVGCEEKETKSLSVTVAGSGSVGSDPAGIDCGQNCQHDFTSGTQVTLTAAPEDGYEFESWGGVCDGDASTCTLALTEDRVVTATFAESGNGDPCEGVDCSDHGSCVDGTCQCDTGYAGTHCSECDTGYELSDGQCVVVTDSCDGVDCSEYYVEPKDSAALNQTDEGATAWQNAQDINNATSAETAMARAVAGDVVYFRGGKYLLSHSDSGFYWYNGALNPSNSGSSSSPITFMAYPGEVPELDTSTAESGWDNGVALGLNCQDYITYDGFKIIADGGASMGAIKLQGNNCSNIDGTVIKNFVLDAGSSVISTSDNREGIRVESTDNTVIENTLMYGYRHTSNWTNTGAIKAYQNNNLTIRNSEIYDSSVGIYLKSRNFDAKIYNNYLHDNYQAAGIQTYLTRNSDRIQFYNNVVANCSMYGFVNNGEEQAHSNDLKLYNNTLYNTGAVALASGKAELGYGVEVYNNIFPSGSTTYTFVTGYTSDPVRGYIKAMDHNLLPSDFKIKARAGGNETYTSLSLWQNSGEEEDGGNPGSGSIAGDAAFVNASGNMNQLGDFRLSTDSPARQAGRNGADMGANISLVGIQNGNILAPSAEADEP